MSNVPSPEDFRVKVFEDRVALGSAPYRQRLSASRSITNSKSPTNSHRVHSGGSPITERALARPRSRNGRL